MKKPILFTCILLWNYNTLSMDVSDLEDYLEEKISIEVRTIPEILSTDDFVRWYSIVQNKEGMPFLICKYHIKWLKWCFKTFSEAQLVGLCREAYLFYLSKKDYYSAEKIFMYYTEVLEDDVNKFSIEDLRSAIRIYEGLWNVSYIPLYLTIRKYYTSFIEKKEEIKKIGKIDYLRDNFNKIIFHEHIPILCLRDKQETFLLKNILMFDKQERQEFLLDLLEYFNVVFRDDLIDREIYYKISSKSMDFLEQTFRIVKLDLRSPIPSSGKMA